MCRSRRLVLAMLVLLTGMSSRLHGAAESPAPTSSYHVQRAVFRCGKMNRGLAWDGRNFWVGEFGGWVRCYDERGRPVPDRDLGGGTVEYLGHGAACGSDFVTTGARDFIAVLPEDGGPMRRIKPAISRFTRTRWRGQTGRAFGR